MRRPTTGRSTTPRSAFWQRSPRDSGLSPTFVFASLRGRLLLPVEGAAPALQRRSVRVAGWRMRSERARLARMFEHGLDRPWVMFCPSARNPPGSSGRAGPWFLRQERCYLVPGRFAAGLPAAAGFAALGAPGDYPVDPSRPIPIAESFPPLPHPTANIRTQLAERDGRQRRRSAMPQRAAGAPQESAALDHPHRDVRRAAQRRAVYLHAAHRPPRGLPGAGRRRRRPPRPRCRNRSSWRATSRPRDPRLNSFQVTPDPGVIEVNIHPSASWDELVDRTTHLYEQARLSRLTSEKFMLDGRHTGTGGGNHFVLGGATPRGLALPAPPGPAAQPAGLLAQPSVAVVPVLRPVHRPHLPGAAQRTRRATIPSTSWRSPSSSCRRRARSARPGWSTGCSATC